MWNQINSILTFSVCFLQSEGTKYPYDRCPWICLLDNYFIINLFKGVTDQLLFIKKNQETFSQIRRQNRVKYYKYNPAEHGIKR